MSSTYSNTSSKIYQSLTPIPQNTEQMKQAINRLKAGASYFGCGGYLCSLDRLHQLDIFTKLGFERLERKHRDIVAIYKQQAEKHYSEFFLLSPLHFVVLGGFYLVPSSGTYSSAVSFCITFCDCGFCSTGFKILVLLASPVCSLVDEAI